MIYLDNAATTWPKPRQVARAMAGALEKFGANPGRGGHMLALRAGRVVEKCRETAAELLGVDSPERLIFTHSCTESLNLAILGMIRDGGEVICSHQEHNAVMRVLKHQVAGGRITVRQLLPEADGIVPASRLRRAISERTCLVILCHAGNVTGVVQPAAAWGAVCREAGVPFLVDAAQSGGVEDVSLDALQANLIALPGHKGLLGPHGTGLLALGRGVEPEPLLRGGTGSASESLDQPRLLPDRYESGTVNLPGIAGLLAGLRFVTAHRAEIREYEHFLANRLRRQLREIPGLTVLADDGAPSVGVVSVTADRMDAGDVGDLLNECGIAVRAGLHCAPAAHSYLGTLQSGAVRFSVGCFNTMQDVDDAAAVMRRILQPRHRGS